MSAKMDSPHDSHRRNMSTKEFSPPYDSNSSYNIRKSMGGSSDVTTTENYFGENARSSFFERFKWLNNQSKITLSDLRQPFDVAHLQFPSVDIPQLDLHQSNTDTPVFTGSNSPRSPRGSTEQKLDGSFKGMMTNEDDQLSTTGVSLSTLSRSSFFGQAPTQPSQQRPSRYSSLNQSPPLDVSGKQNLRGSAERKVYRYQAPVAPKTPNSRTSFPNINGASDNRSVVSRRSYASSRTTRSSFSPGLNSSNPASNESEDFAFINDFFLQNDDFSSSHDDQDLQLISPRTKFLASCIKDQINPRASLLLRKQITTKLDLKHQGMNDKIAKSFAKSLQHLPYLENINLMDNMLTDIGLTSIIQSIMNMTTLKELNLSQNKLGLYSAKALKDYLLSPNCSLEVLLLSRSNIDDSECAQFIHAIEKLPSLTELDLSHNSVGKGEKVLKQTSGNTTTGTQALAELLRSADCNLKTLNLEWNLIRLDGATSLTKSLAFNQTLLHLNLSYNTLNTDAGIALGMSIIQNKVLETINLSYTSLDTIGCITVCAGIIQNRSLKKMNLDGNPIGDQGGKALLIATIFSKRDVEITALKCNVTIKDPKCWFSFDRLNQEYTLNLENGFHRAVLIFLLNIIAGHPTLRFEKLNYESIGKGGKGDGKMRPIDLITHLSNEPERYFNARQREVFDSLHRIQQVTSHYKAAAQFFEEIDTDGSGVLEFNEFAVLMQKLGIEINEKRLQQIMKKYDTDNSNSIDMTGFLMLLRHQRGEAKCRAHDMQYSPVMISATESNPTADTPPYIPPESGNMHVVVASDFLSLKTEGYRILTSYQCDNLLKISNQLGSNNLLSIISACIETVRLRYNEAIMLADIMLLESSDKIEVTRKILLQMHDTHDTAHFLHAIFGDNRQEVMRFKWEFNYLLRPLLGCPNGYYQLDLSKELHRKCLMKLLEINTLQTEERRQKSKISPGRFGDLSQNGNFSCFRNELFNGKPLLMSGSFISPMPFTGKLEFDFSSTERPPKDLIVITDKKFLRILLRHTLLKPTDVGVALFKLEEWKQFNELSVLCSGVNFYECPADRARQIAQHMDDFYLKLDQRAAQHQETKEKICKPLVAGVEGAVLRDSYPVPASIEDYLLREDQHQTVELLSKKISLNTSTDEGDGRFSPIDVHRFLQDEKNMEFASPIGNMWESENNTPILRIQTNTSDADQHEVFPQGLSPFRTANSPLKRPPSRLPIRDSIKSMKVNSQKFQEEEEAEAMKDKDNHPSVEEAIDWVQEYELVKQSKLSNLRRMKSKRLKAMIRRLSFLREKNFVIFPTTDIFLQKFKLELESDQVQMGLKAHKLVDLLEEVLTRNWFYCRHLALLLECFVQYGYFKQTQFFGTYRVELVVSLFTRIIDIHNFEIVLQVLSPFEVACVICRLGYLNIFNPCKPEGSWELDLSRREERLVVKMLCMLGIYEPGDNFFNESFRWSRDSESMPGWELVSVFSVFLSVLCDDTYTQTQSWLTDEGLPNRGVISLTYYSGEGKELNGCKPFISFRKALLSLVLIDEEEVVHEELRGKPVSRRKVLPGDRCFDRYQGNHNFFLPLLTSDNGIYVELWETYFAPLPTNTTNNNKKESKKK